MFLVRRPDVPGLTAGPLTPITKLRVRVWGLFTSLPGIHIREIVAWRTPASVYWRACPAPNRLTFWVTTCFLLHQSFQIVDELWVVFLETWNDRPKMCVGFDDNADCEALASRLDGDSMTRPYIGRL